MGPRASLAAALALALALASPVARADGAAGVPLQVITATDDVRACVVTEGGVTLAGTAGGLAVYGADHALAQVVTALDGLPDTRVHALLVEGKTVWIGTERGLAKATLDHGRAVLTASFASPPVRAIARHEQALFVGTWGGGVQRLLQEERGGRLARVPQDAPPFDVRTRVTSLAEWNGALIGGTAGGGLVRLTPGAAQVTTWTGSRAPATVWALAPRDGRLFIGALEGAVSLGAAGTARLEDGADTRALAGVDGAMLLGTFGKGVLRAAAKDDAPGPASDAKFVQALDPRGACVGTNAGAWASGARLGARGLPENDVTAIAKDGGALWVGTYERGVSVLEGSTWRHIPQVDGRVNGIAVEGRRAWVATARGLTSIEGAEVHTYGGGGVLPSSAVHAVVSLAGGGVLVGTEKGAAIVKGGAVTRMDDKQGLPVRAVWAVAEAPDGVLLLGTSAGLYAGRPGGPWQRVAIVTGHLKDDWVTSLVTDGASVFVGTYNAGVTRLALVNGKLEPGEHLGGGYVNPAGLALANGKLYAATMDGLLVRAAQGPSAWRALEGAQLGKDVTGVLTDGHEAWVASRRGLVRARVE